jgi:pimeloyl-ACP methyl ester carboxylesterase
MPFATAADGARIYYEETGSGEPLLLISGQGGDHTGWAPIVPDLAAHYRVLSFDHRGTGQSDKPTDPAGYTTRNMANDAIAVLDAAGIDRAHAYGHSMGGRVGQWLGIEHPDRLISLVLSATTPGNAHGVRRPAEVDARMRDRGDPRELLHGRYSPEWLALNPDFEAALLARQPLPETWQKLHYAASEGHDAWDEIPSIKTPVLLIHGDNDQVNMSANSPLLAERIKGAELHMVKGGRHGFNVEFQEENSRVVLDFLKRHPA